MDRKEHWQRVYTTKEPNAVSWYQAAPTVSAQLLEAAGLSDHTWILDVGGGDSRFVDFLLSRNVGCVCVLDISRAALDRAAARLGDSARRVQWIEADVTGEWPVPTVNVWHDRAVFHFLTEDASRQRYRARLREAVPHGGSVIIATFAQDGPEKCSGLPVVRYSPESLEKELGGGFRLVEALRKTHATPFGTSQEFWYSRFTVIG